MHLHEILRCVIRVLGHQLGVGSTDVVHVIVLEHITAGWLRNHDVVALAHFSRQRSHVVDGNFCKRSEVSTVQISGTTTSGFAQAAFNSVVFIHPHQRLSDGRLLILHHTRGKHGDTPLLFANPNFWVQVKPSRKPQLGKQWQRSVTGNSGEQRE